MRGRVAAEGPHEALLARFEADNLTDVVLRLHAEAPTP